MYYKNFFVILLQIVKRSGWCFKIERISLINDEMLCDKFGLELFGILLKQKSKAEQTQDRTRAEPSSAPYFQPTPFCVGTIGF